MLALKQLVLGRGADLMFFFDDTRHKLIKWSLWILEFMIMSLQVVGLTFSYFWSIIPFYNKVLTFQNAADILLCCVCLSAVKNKNKFWSAFFKKLYAACVSVLLLCSPLCWAADKWLLKANWRHRPRLRRFCAWRCKNKSRYSFIWIYMVYSYSNHIVVDI
jgi:hypothetical protein